MSKFVIFQVLVIVYAKSPASDRCSSLCELNPSCNISDHGSYCKTWQEPPTCFGFVLEDNNRTSTCYLPTNPKGCNGTQAVLCVEPSINTTILPTTLSTTNRLPILSSVCRDACRSLKSCSAGSYCKADLTPQVCFGLYYQNSSICYALDNKNCTSTIPVLCEELIIKNSTTKIYNMMNTTLSPSASTSSTRTLSLALLI